MKRMSRSEWVKTPYAKSTARDPDGAILALLAKYKIITVQTTHGKGINGRPAFQLRFMMNDRAYCITREVLDADAHPDELMRQMKRGVYHRLKVTLEETTLFPAEEVLFPYLELPAAGGVIIYQAAQPALAKFEPPDFGRLMLPSPSGDES